MRKLFLTKPELAEMFIQFVRDTEKYLDGQKVLYEKRENDHDYLQRKGRELTWDIGRKMDLKGMGVNPDIIGELLVYLARGDEDMVKLKLNILKEAAQWLTV